MDKIAVIVPVYKTEKFISRCIDSILNQTYRDFFLILIDDGSPDNCGRICDEYANKDTRIHVIHQANKGVSAARNAGVDLVMNKSEINWITFIDSDDWVSSNYLEVLLNACIKYDVKIAACRTMVAYVDMPFDTIETANIKAIKTEDYYFIDGNSRSSSCAIMFTKEVFCSVRFPLGVRFEDTFTTYKLLFQYDLMAYIDNQLYAYYMNPNSFMHEEWNPGRLLSIESVYEQIAFFKSISYSAYKKSVIVYLNQLIGTMKLIEATNESSYTKYYKRIKRKLRWALIKYRLYSLRKYYYYYKFAYPALCKILI